MTTLVVAFALGSLLGFGAGKVKLRRGPVNVVRGMLLPNPSDDRWQFEHVSFSGRRWKLGAVEVDPNYGFVWVDDVRVKRAERYGKAVAAAQMERKALAAALGEP